MMEPSGKAYALSDMRQELGGPDPRHDGTPTAKSPPRVRTGGVVVPPHFAARRNDGATFDSANGGAVETY